jgi:hypothetical protein
LTFLFFSVLEIGYLVYKQPTFSRWSDWIIVAGAVLFRMGRSPVTVAEWANTAADELRCYTEQANYSRVGAVTA